MSKHLLNLMILKNQNGSMLIMVIIVSTLLVLFTPVVIMTMENETKQSATYEQKSQAYYYAKSGAEVALDWMGVNKDNKEVVQDFLDTLESSPDRKAYIYGTLDELKITTDSAIVVTEKPDINVIISYDEEEKEVILTSKANHREHNNRVSVKLELEEPTSGEAPSGKEWLLPLLDMAVFSVSDGNDPKPAFEITGSSEVHGPVGTNSTVENSVKFGWSTVVTGGPFYVGPDSDYNDVIFVAGAGRSPEDNIKSGQIYPLPEERVYPMPHFPDFPENLPNKGNFTTPWISGLYYEINQNGYYDLIEASSNRTITIDLNNQTRIIRVGNLNIAQGHINLINKGENGRLILYVDNSITLGGDSTVNYNGKIEDIMLYYKGSNPINFSGNTKFIGNTFVKNANFTAGGSGNFLGHLIVGGSEVTMHGNPRVDSQVVYAPNAHVEVLGSGEVRNSIIAKTFLNSGNGRVYYHYDTDQSAFEETFPFEVFDDINNGESGGATSNSAMTFKTIRWGD